MSLHDKARIKWACRRGMLELDVIIMPFFDACFDQLTEIEKTQLVAFLEYDDPDLFAWLMGHAICSDENVVGMIDKIVTYNRSQLR